MRTRKILVSILCASVSLLMLCACGGNKNEIKIDSWKEDVSSSDSPSKSQEPVIIEVGEDETWFISFGEDEDSMKEYLETQETNEKEDEKEKEEEANAPTLESSITIEQVAPTNDDDISIENNGEDSSDTITP